MLRIGILGFGRIGAEHAEWIRRAGLDASVVFDATPARRELAASRGHRIVDTVDALLDPNRVDAVLIATPSAMHFEHAAQALRAGMHVMIEKPMTLDLESSKALVEHADSAGRVLSVFHNRRWDIDYLTVQHAVRSGALGRVFNIESRLGQWSSCVGPAAREYRPGWRNEAAFGGGGLFDWGSHFVDQLWRLMLPDRPVRVTAQLRGNVWTRDCDDFARVCIDFASGACGMVEINTTTTRPLPRWHVDGSLGSADSPFSLAFDTRRWAELTLTPADGSDERRLPTAPAGLDEPAIWQAFAEACGGNRPPAVSARSVLPTMAILDAARIASRDGRAVLLDLKLFDDID